MDWIYWLYWLRKHVGPAPWLYVNRLRNRSKQIAKRCSNTARNRMAVGRNLLARVDPLFSESCLWGCGGWGEGGLLEGDGAWGVLGAEGVLSLACGGSSFSLIPSIWGLSFFRSPPLQKQHAGQPRKIWYTWKHEESWASQHWGHSDEYISSGWKNNTY